MAMGDIAFNLLIFFVILARAQDDSHLQWTPAEAAELETAQHTKVSVLVDKDQKLYLNGQQVSVSELESKVESMLGNLPAEERFVHLKVHDQTTALQFEPIIEAVSKAGGTLYHIVEEEQEP